jgi:hypothetical protein
MLKAEWFKEIPIKDFNKFKKENILVTYKDLPVDYN